MGYPELQDMRPRLTEAKVTKFVSYYNNVSAFPTNSMGDKIYGQIYKIHFFKLFIVLE